MYKDYNMTQLTLPMETSVLIPINDMSRHVNEIVETIPENEFDEFNRTPLITYGMFIKDKTNKYKSDIFNTQNWEYDEINDEFICSNHKRFAFKSYAYRHDKYGIRRDFKLYECDDCSGCSLKNRCMKSNSKSNKTIMRNYNWEYFKAQINQKVSEPETKEIYNQRKIDVEPVFGFMKAILGFTRMSVRGINKVKRELGFVLMALNIRKIVALRANYNQNNNEKGNFYIISIEIAFFHLSENFMSRPHFLFESLYC